MGIKRNGIRVKTTLRNAAGISLVPGVRLPGELIAGKWGCGEEMRGVEERIDAEGVRGMESREGDCRH